MIQDFQDTGFVGKKPPSACIWCFTPFKKGDKVRSVHPTLRLVHPQYHIFPDGANASGERVPYGCINNHYDEHLHEGECTVAYCEKVGLTYYEGKKVFSLEDLQKVMEPLGSGEIILGVLNENQDEDDECDDED